MRKYLKIASSLLLVFLSLNTKAQEIKVKAELDSSIILIGDQVKLNLQIEYPGDINILFPVVGDSLGESVEVVERMLVDSVDLGDNKKSMSQTYIVTSFDTGQHVIPPFQFRFTYKDFTDSIESNEVNLYVFTLPKIDSLMNALKGPIDIKPPYKAPVTFKEVAPWIMGVLLALGIAFLIWYAVKRKRDNKPLFSLPQKPKEPAHIIALRRLDEIKEQKIWQQGKTKEYYSEVTDTLREYIENRFKINALELTSDEIISAFKYRNSLVDENTFSNLVRILKNADLVKFAKYEPLPDDNNLALVDTYFFVNQTKEEMARPTEDNIVDEEEGEDVIIK